MKYIDNNFKTEKPLESDIKVKDTKIGSITSHSSDQYHNGAFKLAYLKKKYLNDKHDDFEIRDAGIQ